MNEFCKKKRIKWNFRNKPSQDFSETLAFRVKSSWKLPKGHPNLEVFLSKTEEEPFKVIVIHLNYFNLFKKRFQAIRSLTDDRSIVIKSR